MNKVIAIIMAILIILSGYLLDWRQQWLVIAQVRHSYPIAQLAKYQAQIVQIPLQQTQLRQADQRISQQQKLLFTVPIPLKQWLADSQATGVTLTNWKTQTLAQHTNYSALSIKMTVMGTYAQLLAFLATTPSQLHWHENWSLVRVAPPITINKISTKNDELLFTSDATFYYHQDIR